ncbi:MAG: AI-2E family transporter, partial [Lachnospiraceae bacterium]|nr:AI-2E family transporter [Lachnospiraceae bacterium]
RRCVYERGLLEADFAQIIPGISGFLGGISVQVIGVFNGFKNLFLGFLISAYLLASRKLFAAQAKLILHGVFNDKWARILEEEVRYIDKMFNGFFMGKIIDSAIIGALCFIGTTLLGFDSAAFISVVIGVTNIIPFFGPLIGAVPCALLLLLENPMHCLYFIIFIIVLQQLDGNVIGPKILGNATGVSSFWVLFSILLFGGLWGIIGMVIGVPLFAVIYDVIRKLVYRGLKKHSHQKMITQYQEEFHQKE